VVSGIFKKLFENLLFACEWSIMAEHEKHIVSLGAHGIGCRLEIMHPEVRYRKWLTRLQFAWRGATSSWQFHEC